MNDGRKPQLCNHVFATHHVEYVTIVYTFVVSFNNGACNMEAIGNGVLVLALKRGARSEKWVISFHCCCSCSCINITAKPYLCYPVHTFDTLLFC